MIGGFYLEIGRKLPMDEENFANWVISCVSRGRSPGQSELSRCCTYVIYCLAVMS